ncbi:hybrid sensor histidine kinase/response regulator [Nitrincola lacisaponensis]
MSDYTSELLRQQQLFAAKEEADRANQAKSSFLSSMSHELRTPMNAILGFAQMLEYDDALDADQQDNVHEIIKAGNHLLVLINEVLDLSKIESGHLELSLEPVEVYPLMDECLSLIKPLAQKHQIHVKHCGLEAWWVRADRTRFKQVLLNLLSNAVKYNREGGEVSVTIQPEGLERLRVLISDTGKGIAPERLGELFDPFNRLDAEGSTVEGTGIGLTITRQIMEMMGGRVDVKSELGVGSTFWLELPLESRGDEAGSAGLLNTTESENRFIPAEQQHLVLYIEDNPANLKLIASLMGRLPHIHLLTAHLPELGLELARVRKPALILLDINMPSMDGYQVLKILKQDAELKEIPVLAVTANAMPRDIERGKQAGFADYITKPIHVNTFLDSVDHWLGQKSNSET